MALERMYIVKGFIYINLQKGLMYFWQFCIIICSITQRLSEHVYG